MSVTAIAGRNAETGYAEELNAIAGGLATAPGTVDVRLARFNAAADMPADITSNANVTAGLVKFTGFASTARRIQIIWHGGANSANAAALAGPIALGARVTINAGDDATAATRLTYTDLTGGGSSASGIADTFMVSKDDAFIEIGMTAAISRIDAIGIPIGVTPTNIVDAFLELRVIG